MKERINNLVKDLIEFKVYQKLLMKLLVIFVLMTVVGTLSHEFGHFVVVEILGMDGEIHYSYMRTIKNENYRHLFKWESILISLGGPIQTMLTGTIGFLLLYEFKNEILKRSRLERKHWAMVFMAMFWLRQTAISFMIIAVYLFQGLIMQKGDESRISLKLGLPVFTLDIITGFVGLIIISIVIFKFIPISQRFTFILSGFAGGVLGYVLWMEILGPKILP